jgi:hypothetical protein
LLAAAAIPDFLVAVMNIRRDEATELLAGGCRSVDLCLPRRQAEPGLPGREQLARQFEIFRLDSPTFFHTTPFWDQRRLFKMPSIPTVPTYCQPEQGGCRGPAPGANCQFGGGDVGWRWHFAHETGTFHPAVDLSLLSCFAVRWQNDCSR